MTSKLLMMLKYHHLTSAKLKMESDHSQQDSNSSSILSSIGHSDNEDHRFKFGAIKIMNIPDLGSAVEFALDCTAKEYDIRALCVNPLQEPKPNNKIAEKRK